MEAGPRVCANCRVLVQPIGAASPDHPFRGWEHVPEFAAKFDRSVCSEPAPGREASGSESRFGLARIKTPGGDKHTIKAEIAELAQPAGTPLTIAVDGSYKLTVTPDRVIKPMSWAYLTTDGHYGLGTSIVPGTVVGGRPDANGSDPERTLQAELRAMANALQVIPPGTPVTVLSDSKDAIGFMHLWRTGHQVWPGGYNPERAGGRESTLGRLARRALADGDIIQVDWVPGHTGHPLNEAADALARMARAWTTEQRDKDQVAAAARQIVLTALDEFATTVG
jgi:ribonuclease HI